MMALDRREFIAASVALLANAGAKAGVASEKTYSDIEVTDRWIRRWMSSLGAAVGELHLGRFADRMYFLRKIS